MRNKKRIVNLLLVIMLLFTLTGCGSNVKNENTSRKDAEKNYRREYGYYRT